jgi:hypothetical protein
MSRRERTAIQIQRLKAYVVIFSPAARAKKRILACCLRPPAKITDIFL